MKNRYYFCLGEYNDNSGGLIYLFVHFSVLASDNPMSRREKDEVLYD